MQATREWGKMFKMLKGEKKREKRREEKKKKEKKNSNSVLCEIIF